MPLLAAAAVLAASYGSGRLLSLRWLQGPDGLRRRANAFALGFGLLAVLAVVLGSLGLFRRDVLAGVALAGAVAGVVAVARDVRPALGAWRSLGRLRWIVGPTILLVLFDFVLAAAPPTSGDATAYHLSAPKLWLDAHETFPIWWSWQSFQPFAVEMHFAYGLALDGGAAAIAVGAGLAAFSAVCVYGLGRELFGPAAGAVGALLWVGQGMFLWEATGGFVELVLGAFVALAVWNVAAFARTGRAADAVVAGAASGLAAATKYHGLLIVPPLLVLVALLGRRSGNAVRVVAGFAAAAAALGCAWYVRNLVETGNPLYPLASSVFGGKYWGATTQADFDAGWQGYGGAPLWRLPLFPLDFVVRHSHYERGYSFGYLLFVLPLVAVVLGGRRVRLLGLALAVYLVVWWEAMHQITRYLLPAVAVAAPLAGYAAVRLWEAGPWRRRSLAALAVVTAIPLVAISGLYAWRLAPGAVGAESQAHFVQRLTGTYDALQTLDRRLPRSGRVLVGLRNLYWLDRPYAAYDLPMFDYGESPAQAESRLRRLDIRYLAFLDGRIPGPLRPLRPRLRRLADLPVREVKSRALGTTESHRLVVWAWCDARGAPCGAG